MEFLEREIEAFEITEGCELEEKAKERNARVKNWCGTWCNPSMSDEQFKQFFEEQLIAGKINYAIFQREKGEENGTIHFQFFVEYKSPQYFKKVKELLPYGSHFAPMISTSERCKDYCSKEDTRVSGPYEIGEMSFQGKRTDLSNAIQMIDEGVPFETVAKIYKSQCLMYGRQLKERAAMVKNEDFMERGRDVEVFYIYGPGGVGKTTRVYQKHGFRDVFAISKYEKYMFEGYDYKPVILFDEFAGQIKITELNRLLDRVPIALRGLGKIYPACYEKVYILSNLPPEKQYMNLEPFEIESREPLMRRIHHIIYIDKARQEHKLKETIFRDMLPNEIPLPGMTKTIDKTIYYDMTGRITKIVDSKQVEQMELSEVAIDAASDMPF